MMGWFVGWLKEKRLGCEEGVRNGDPVGQGAEWIGLDDAVEGIDGEDVDCNIGWVEGIPTEG